MSDEAPKSAFELAMERLRQKDRDEGVEERPLSEEQRERLAEVRRVYDAKLAELEILHASSRRQAVEHEALERLDEGYRREREHLNAERERKNAEIRAGR
jgi:hypothetical protein